MAGDRYISPIIQQIMQRWQESPLSKSGAGGHTRTQSDPFHQMPFFTTSLGIQTRIVAGMVSDVMPRGHCYKVAVENGRSFVVATLMTAASCSEVGACPIGMLQPGTRVWLLLHPQMKHAVIIGVEPNYGSALGGLLPDLISQTTRTFVDDGYFQPLMFPKNEVIDFSSGRPMDGLPGYEQGWISSTGTKITIDDFLVQLAVNEHCGVFGFYHDSLLRVAGLNLQILAAAAENEWLNDSNEAYEYHGSTPYVWEQSGQLQPQVDPITARTSQQFLVSQSEYGKWEPVNPLAKAFHRTQRFGGYLGQGMHDFVTLPPAGDTTYNYGPGNPLSGVYDYSVGLDGRLGIRSAKGIHIAKKIVIPVPRQVKRPEDPAGDNPDNYKFAGTFGDGPTQPITGDIFTTDPNSSLQRAAGILDLHAYIFNYQGTHPFYFHTEDWDVPEESEMNLSNQILPAFASLASKMYLNSPTPVQQTVDQRYGKQSYYQTESALSLLDDGAIVLYDGFGAEIKMVGGSMFLSCPGDLWLKPGRNLHLWAGGNIDIRAKDSVDVSASTNDVRVKAERNFLTLSGNSGQGGTLFESRGAGESYDFSTPGSPQFGGIAMQAANGDIAMWSAAAYIRTVNGDITLDANRGQGDLLVNANSEFHAIVGAVEYAFGTTATITAVTEFSAEGTALAGGLEVGGAAVIGGGLMTNSSIIVLNGHIATQNAQQDSYLVPAITGSNLQQAVASMESVTNDLDTALPQASTTTYAAAFTNGLYSANEAGNDTVIREGQFTFRTDSQYNIHDFALYEDRWQHLARAGNVQLVSWQEPAVQSNVGTTYPYPGQNGFTSNNFYQQTDKLVDGATGNAVDRSDSGYTDPTFAASTKTSLQQYPVIS